MIFPLLFRKSLLFSVIGHLTIFSLFSFSFGRRLPSADISKIYFWGDFLRANQVTAPLSAQFNLTRNSINNIKLIRDFFKPKAEAVKLPKIERESYVSPRGYIKPPLVRGFGAEKSILVRKTAPERFARRSSEPSIVFHPVLPYDFTLYFKDRQVAHVELMFKIVTSGTRNLIDIKRKISSGNPEVDLLTMRYISHYLFIQQTRFPANNWQTVKIDLSAKK
jgi:hypothetical protein